MYIYTYEHIYIYIRTNAYIKSEAVWTMYVGFFARCFVFQDVYPMQDIHPTGYMYESACMCYMHTCMHTKLRT